MMGSVRDASSAVITYLLPLFLLRAAADCAREAKLPAGVLPPCERAVADWMRAAALVFIGVRLVGAPLAPLREGLVAFRFIVLLLLLSTLLHT